MEVAFTRMSQNGQIVIPAEIRQDAHLEPKASFIVVSENEDIWLKRVNKKELLEEMQLRRDIEEGLKDIEEGRCTSFTEEEFKDFKKVDKILMGE